MSPELINAIFQASRYLFAFLAALAVLAALGWVHAEKSNRRDRLRSLPEAGKIGELVVLSGSDELPPQTWFPVTREGVLGSVRSCDLVVPCSGVKAHHLDYTWRDGVGLIIRPRSGCEALVNGVPLNCRSDAISFPLTHGSCLQVGDAVLRLQVLKALDHTYAAPEIPAQESYFPEQAMYLMPDAPVPYDFTGMPPQTSEPPMAAAQPDMHAPYCQSDVPVASPMQAPYCPPAMPAAFPVQAFQSCTPTDSAAAPAPVSPSPVQPPRRSDRWKEDWGE